MSKLAQEGWKPHPGCMVGNPEAGSDSDEDYREEASHFISTCDHQYNRNVQKIQTRRTGEDLGPRQIRG